MKKTFICSAFLFAALLVSALVSNAQSNSTPAKQESAQQTAQTPPPAFFNVESLDNAKNKMEDAYVKYQNAPAEQADALGAEFRQLRRLYLVELEKQSANYPSTTPIGAKIHSEMTSTYKDMR